MKNQKRLDVKILTEDAIFVALAMALTYLPHDLGAGGAINISFGSIPIIFISLKRGLLNGILSGFIFGILDLFLRGLGSTNVVSIQQAFLEYIVAFSVIGCAGFFSRSLNKTIKNSKKLSATIFIVLGVFIATFLKYSCHFFASALFFKQYLPSKVNVWLASFIYQIPSFLSTFIFAAFVLTIVYLIRPKLFSND